MKTYSIASYVGGLLFASLMAGCTADVESPATEPEGIRFEVRTRAAEDALSVPDDTKQYTCLYIAERKPEDDVEHLYCPESHRHTLTGGHYSLTGLYGQWYKFAFLCMPKWEKDGKEEGGKALLTEEPNDVRPWEKTNDFNKLLIDFAPVLSHQQDNINIAQTQDLNLYRKTMDWWIDPKPNPEDPKQEDVEMVRMTGELDIDMGIPADQFPKDVEYIRLTLRNPMATAYIRDEARDEVITQASQGDMVYTLNFPKPEEEKYAAFVSQRQKLRLCLLPQVLEGWILVKYRDTDESLYYSIGTDAENGDTRIEVRKNRVTTVLYNGMQKDEFEVRYAGFNDDATVDVDEDEWGDGLK